MEAQRPAADDVSASSSGSPTAGWKRYASPAGFYSVKYPADWHVVEEDNIVNIAPPDESGAITISAYHGEAPIPNFPRTWLRDSFETEIPTAEPEPISRNGWQGYRQEFRGKDEAEQPSWIAIVAQKGPIFVLITANDSDSRMQARRTTYERIMNSLRLHPRE